MCVCVSPTRIERVHTYSRLNNLLSLPSVIVFIFVFHRCVAFCLRARFCSFARVQTFHNYHDRQRNCTVCLNTILDPVKDTLHNETFRFALREFDLLHVHANIDIYFPTFCGNRIFPILLLLHYYLSLLFIYICQFIQFECRCPV